MNRVLALVVVLVMALTGCATTTSPSSTTALPTPTIGLTYIPNVQFSPFYVAKTDGEFTKAGVNPTLRHHGTSEGLFTALVAGTEQFVLAGGDELMQARSQGMDLVAVSSYYRSYPVEVIVGKSSTIASLADLKGRTIGLPGKYGESWFGLLVALRTAGLSESDVTIKEIGYTQTAALSTGKVDAVIGFSNNDAVQFELAGFATRSLAIASGTVPLVPASLITTTAYANQHPEVVKSVVAGTRAGISSVVKDPQHALTVSIDFIPDLTTAAGTASATAVLNATTKLWTTADGSVDSALDAKQWKAMADFMFQQKLTAVRQDQAAAMTNAFI